MSDLRLARLREKCSELADKRRAEILAAAMVEARTVGFQWITREAVASLAGCSEATVSMSFGSMPDLKRAVLAEAVRVEDLVIVAQGLADRHAIVLAASEDLRKRAAATLA